MNNLYRVIKEETWTEVSQSQHIPRCGNDNKKDRIHLNVLEAVETIAARYFEPEERPVVLEVDPSDFAEQIEWAEATAESPWRQPLANISNLPVSAVVKVHRLEHSLVDGKNEYKLTKET